MRRFGLTRSDEWRRRQPLLSGLQRNFGSQMGAAAWVEQKV